MSQDEIHGVRSASRQPFKAKDIEFKLGDRVWVELPSLGGKFAGTVLGVQAKFPVVGQIYIVNLDAVPSDDYPWTAVCIPEAAMTFTTKPPPKPEEAICKALDTRSEVHCCNEHPCGWCWECRGIPG